MLKAELDWLESLIKNGAEFCPSDKVNLLINSKLLPNWPEKLGVQYVCACTVFDTIQQNIAAMIIFLYMGILLQI